MKRYLLRCSAAAWLITSIAGSIALARFAYAPAPDGKPAASWPAGTAIPRDSEDFTLVMLAHPQCPCTQASLENLARLMAHAHGRLRAHVVFLRPEGFPAGWEHGKLWDTAAAIPGVSVWTDIGGEKNERFGAWTSGQVLLYDPRGELRFSGGITQGRGHAGDNPGLDAVRAALRPGSQGFTSGRVFGCSLRTPRGNL